jgi:hypothetical protein
MSYFCTLSLENNQKEFSYQTACKTSCKLVDLYHPLCCLYVINELLSIFAVYVYFEKVVVLNRSASHLFSY